MILWPCVCGQDLVGACSFLGYCQTMIYHGGGNLHHHPACHNAQCTPRITPRQILSLSQSDSSEYGSLVLVGAGECGWGRRGGKRSLSIAQGLLIVIHRMGLGGLGTLQSGIKSKAYIPLQRKTIGVGSWRWLRPPTPPFCVT